MNVGFVALALLMGAVTYPWRAVPLLAGGLEKLPGRVLDYLRLVGPAVLAALAAVNVTIARDPGPTFHVGIEWLAVGACVALVAWRRGLLLGLVAAAVLVAIARAVGLA